jgi:hypothetical protein
MTSDKSPERARGSQGAEASSQAGAARLRRQAHPEGNVEDTIRASRDIIVRTNAWTNAINFYGSVLGLPVFHRGESIVGFETGAFRLYVEKGDPHGPVFEFLVPDVQATKQRLIANGCVLLEEDAAVPRCYLCDPCGLVFNIGLAQSK